MLELCLIFGGKLEKYSTYQLIILLLFIAYYICDDLC